MFNYSMDALNLALALRNAMDNGSGMLASLCRGLPGGIELRTEFDPGIVKLKALCNELTDLCNAQAEIRARAQKARSGTSRKYREEEMQALFVAALRADPLQWDPLQWGIVAVHHTPMGFHRTRFQQVQAKRAGAGAGWPDLDIRLVDQDGRSVSKLLELKVGQGRASKEQQATISRLTGAGFDISIANGLFDACLTILESLRGGAELW
jgi:hypothetical protein